MNRILIVEEFNIVKIGLTQIFKKIGFDEGSIDFADSLDKMLSMVDVTDYEMIFFGLNIQHGKELFQLLETVQNNSTTSFMVFSEPIGIDIQKKIYTLGVSSIVDRNATQKEISFAIQRVLDREMYIGTSSIKMFSLAIEKKSANILSLREKKIAELLLEGKKNTQICDILQITPSTVSTLKTRIFNKLKIRSLVELKTAVSVINRSF